MGTAAAHEAPQPAAAPAPPVRAAASPATPGLTTATVLRLQRSAGNAAVARLLAGARPRQLQRDCGGDCGCSDCSTTEASPGLGAGLDEGSELDVPGRRGERCEPSRRITGTVFVPDAEAEIAVARKAVDGSKAALAKQNVVLDLEISKFQESGNLKFADKDGDRSVDKYATVCRMLKELQGKRSSKGVVVLVVPISGEICASHGMACYVPNLDAKCGDSPLKRVIIIGRFMAESQIPTVLAHELGHHAGEPQPNDPTTFGHTPFDKRNYMGFEADRDHYRSEVLDRMCRIPFEF